MGATTAKDDSIRDAGVLFRLAARGFDQGCRGIAAEVASACDFAVSLAFSVVNSSLGRYENFEFDAALSV